MPVTELLIERQGPVVILTRTGSPLNLATLDSTAALARAVEQCSADRGVRAVVLTAAGDRFFGAGSDIAEFTELRERGDVTGSKMTPETDALARLEELPKPTVAALNGTALGGGLELALCCDFIIAEAGTSVGLPEINLGLFPGDGGPVRATRRVGAARAKRLMFLGEVVSVETALAWGLVDEVVPRGGALERATELARQCASKPHVALAACKQAIAMSFEPSASELTRAALPLFEQVFHSADATEGVRAFLAKEQPRFAE